VTEASAIMSRIEAMANTAKSSAGHLKPTPSPIQKIPKVVSMMPTADLARWRGSLRLGLAVLTIVVNVDQPAGPIEAVHRKIVRVYSSWWPYLMSVSHAR